MAAYFYFLSVNNAGKGVYHEKNFVSYRSYAVTLDDFFILRRKENSSL